MSIAKGTKYLSPVLMQAYLKSGAADILFNEYRKQLDQQRSIVGISAKDLFPNAAIGDSRAAYNQAYKELLSAV